MQGQTNVQPGGQMTGHVLVHGVRTLVVGVGVATAPIVTTEKVETMALSLMIMPSESKAQSVMLSVRTHLAHLLGILVSTRSDVCRYLSVLF